ncbi:hypothetical protein VHEMI01580 [[Torrubiella] hemipterigena]|uniref:Formylmethionine deformylase-like protein n=1 Tax=[Torrubiella] hemipterigena TaxID=1531966 RepID=A0A0A1SMA3_9HYPO|nr:hypothetical protein VHEMI01580 [[Torrubiella] hemipterigena]
MAANTPFTRRSVLILMIGSLLGGFMFAIGHHLFYLSLDGRIIHGQDDQEWNIRIGTGLAFLVKLCLATAVGVSYTQLLWSILKEKAVKLQTIDSLFSLPHNATQFFCLEIWHKASILVPIAAFLWLLPLIAIVTPGTLTVITAPRPQVNMTTMTKPTLNFTIKDTFVHFSPQGANTYGGPSNAFARLISTVLSQGRIQPFSTPSPNIEYDLNFYAPSVSCEPMGGSEAFQKRFNNMLGNDTVGDHVTFMAFVPIQPFNPQGIRDSVEDQIFNGFNESNIPTRDSPVYVDYASVDHARLLFFAYANDSRVSAAQSTWQCGFFNSSYQTTVRFDDNKQSIKIHNITHQNGILGSAGETTTGAIDVEQLFVGAYVKGFTSPFIGRVEYSHHGSSAQVFTTVFSTVLMQSRELNSGQPGSQPLEAYEHSIIGNISMAEAIEQLSHNISLSLFSDPHFLSQDKNLPTIPLRSWGPQLQYTYNPRNVYIAYGLGIAVTIFAVSLGLVAIFRSSLTYGASFSTILRTTRAAGLDHLVTPAESTGAEPLSEQLAQRRLRFQLRDDSYGAIKGAMAFQIADEPNSLSSQPTHSQRAGLDAHYGMPSKRLDGINTSHSSFANSGNNGYGRDSLSVCYHSQSRPR